MKKSEDFKSLLEISKEFLLLTTKELDPYTTEKGSVKVLEDKIILFTPSHIQFARYGRGPGRKPPFDFILEWVKRENIKFEGSTQEGTAFAIQTSIGKKGTKNWVSGAPNALQEALKKNFKAYNEQLRNALKIIVKEEVDKVTTTINFEEKFGI